MHCIYFDVFGHLYEQLRFLKVSADFVSKRRQKLSEIWRLFTDYKIFGYICTIYFVLATHETISNTELVHFVIPSNYKVFWTNNFETICRQNKHTHIRLSSLFSISHDMKEVVSNFLFIPSSPSLFTFFTLRHNESFNALGSRFCH